MNIPLLGPSISDQTIDSFHNYINSLRDDNFKRKYKPKKEFRIVSVSQNKKGSYIVKVKRNPKEVLQSELDALAKELNISIPKMWDIFKSRKIPIVDKLNTTLILRDSDLPW